ncbi:hypothetical protein HRbin27_00619 [bacterium HR27]|nr:hypothetical protein HRbin27_00619 [bacterium HR27]
MTRIRLFTHPICQGCTEALALVEQLARSEPALEVEVISLATPRGRTMAQEAGVVVVPTLVVDGERFVGVPSWEELCTLVQRASRSGGAA